jgi:hypothetical protein
VAKLRVHEIEAILDAMKSDIRPFMEQAADMGIPIDAIVTAVEELAINWQYARKAKRARSRKKE